MNTKPSPVTFNNLGKAYCEKNQLDSALKYFNKAIELNQYFSEAYFERGVAKQKNNDKEGACKDWKTASAFGYKDSTYSLDKFCSQQFQK